MQELPFLIIIGLQFFYIIYSDIQNRKERESWALKVMSRDVDEYKSVTEDTPEDSPKKEEDPYIPIEEVGADRIVGAKE